LRESAMRSAVVIPISVAGRRACALAVETTREDRTWPEPLVRRLQFIGEIVATALDRFRQAETLRQTRLDVERLATAPEPEEGPAPMPKTLVKADFDEIIGGSAALKAALARVKEVLPTDSTVLILGETGTGKELVARALHAHGPRHDYPLVSVNCAALP